MENMENYDVVFLGYPNWWYGVPMALLSFLEDHDLSGKQVYLFCSHGTGGLARSVDIITEAFPAWKFRITFLTVTRRTRRLPRSDRKLADGAGILGVFVWMGQKNKQQREGEMMKKLFTIHSGGYGECSDGHAGVCRSLENGNRKQSEYVVV